MSRIRSISPTKAVFVSTNATGSQATINQLNRIQSENHNSQVTLTPVEQFGQQAPLDQIIVQPMTVSLDFSYLLSNVLNESNLGFVVNGSTQAISGILNGTTDERNYYIETSPYGTDAEGGDIVAANNQCVGISNGFISKYSVDCAVNQIPKVDVNIEALNIVGYLSTSGQNSPAIIPSGGQRVVGQTFSLPNATSGVDGGISALRPGDVYFSIPNLPYGVDVTDIKVQSFKIDIDLAREPQEKLGSYFPFTKTLRFPIPVNVSINANIGDIITGSLSDVLCNNQDYSLVLGVRTPNCLGTGPVAVQYTVNGAKLESQNYSTPLNNNETVALTFKALIGGVTDVLHSFLISGSLTS